MKIVKLFRQTLQKMLYINCVQIHSNHCILEIVSYARYQIAKPKMFCKKKNRKRVRKKCLRIIQITRNCAELHIYRILFKDRPRFSEW